MHQMKNIEIDNKPFVVKLSERFGRMETPRKKRKCPRCNSTDVLLQDSFEDGIDLYICADCDHEFEVGGSRPKRRDEDHDLRDYYDKESTGSDWDR